MTILNRASVVFTILDNYNKSPIDDVSILCDGEYVPFIKKGHGNHVFINMPEGIHNFLIEAVGYLPTQCDLEISNDKVGTVIAPLNYSPDNPKLLNLRKIKFKITENGKDVKDDVLFIMQDYKANFLKLIAPVNAGDTRIKLNTDLNTDLFFQEFVSSSQINSLIVFNGYDKEADSYISCSKCGAMGNGSYLNPIWRLYIPKNGEAVIAINRFYMQKDEVELTLIYKNMRKQLKFDVTKDNYVELNF